MNKIELFSILTESVSLAKCIKNVLDQQVDKSFLIHLARETDSVARQKHPNGPLLDISRNLGVLTLFQ